MSADMELSELAENNAVPADTGGPRGEVVMVDDSRLGVTMTEIVKADRAI